MSRRTELWSEFIRRHGIKTVAEIGVWRGEFAEAILRACPAIERYYMIDPWRRLEEWNKPANVAQDKFEAIFSEAMERTEFASTRRVVLRGLTKEVVHEIPDGSLDFAYIDGDHTLRGILIDLHCCYPKVRDTGYLAGDDFTPSIWQHSPRFEPSMVFPVAVHFAEAVDRPITALPYNQFRIDKGAVGFSFSHPAGTHEDTGILSQIQSMPSMLPPSHS